MTFDELCEWVESHKNEIPGETEILAAMQPAWPFEYTLDINENAEIDNGSLCAFCERGQEGYLREQFENELNWR